MYELVTWFFFEKKVLILSLYHSDFETKHLKFGKQIADYYFKQDFKF